LARLVVAYWLARHVPAYPDDPTRWTLNVDDWSAICNFAEDPTTGQGAWAGDLAAGALLDKFAPGNPDDQERIVGLIAHINQALADGFQDSRPFHEYLETVVLHSLAVVVKNQCALLGGVSPDSLVVYVDLPNLDRVSPPDQPRILVMDT